MPGTVEEQLRRFLLVISGLIFIAAVIELRFVEHAESLIQLIPFILCGLGLIGVIAVLRAPKRPVVLLLRIIMGVVIFGTFLGWYEHIAHNVAFELEIRPNATVGDVFWESLSGASPLLAPGILALGAILALAATYRHPALNTSKKPM